MKIITGREFQNWLDATDIRAIEYSEYWNNEDIEKEKEWYILDGNFIQMENYIKKEGFPEDIRRCIQDLQTEFNRTVHGTGIDLAAGNLWAIPLLFKLSNLERMYCLEYSQHRLTKLGAAILDHYNIPKEKTVLVYGSFYDIHVEDRSLDFIFLSQAFHHADDPERLLTEMQRVLKPDGCVIIIGEHSVSYFVAYCKYYGKYLIKSLIHLLIPETLQKKVFHRTFSIPRLFPKSADLLPPDSVLGDHYYTPGEYSRMFRAHGFLEREVKSSKPSHKSYILTNQIKP